MANLNINNFLMQTTIEGPGKRFAVWFQGCSIGCRDCSNQEMLSFDKKMFLPVSLLMEKIKEAKLKFLIEGITILGGEPFLQPDGLLELVEGCKKLNLNIIIFSGYLYENLEKQFFEILAQIDILIDGPFIASKLDRNRRLIGSTNQRVIKISDHFEGDDYFEKAVWEVDIHIKNSVATINGDGSILEDDLGKNLFQIESEN
ncbi:thiol peroxidase [Spiroplasma sabaudiense Ar-1343]|uniref:Thiol peroxidase n=1 Tax=Spiroplasma sabaudiense Ar-1343 TaxID=1276257 RepID=W6AB87_9MOLU|nr:4Fe-4S single cluster domain-containing protein [Spiroplasma sabaudiense]AHI54120.1 thiol peroxidase [Spiroplasma sabaudiense Ar-1343]